MWDSLAAFRVEVVRLEYPAIGHGVRVTYFDNQLREEEELGGRDGQ